MFGSAVGYERRTADKPAGLRTLSLVALGSALFAIISAFGFDTADQSRVAAQIVTGVGFLGAGTILRSGVTISGLTTAATICATAAIGMAVGFGLYIAAASGRFSCWSSCIYSHRLDSKRNRISATCRRDQSPSPFPMEEPGLRERSACHPGVSQRCTITRDVLGKSVSRHSIDNLG